MADRKISQFTRKENVLPFDVLPILDSQVPSGQEESNKKIYMKDLHRMKVVDLSSSSAVDQNDAFSYITNSSSNNITIDVTSPSLALGEYFFFEQKNIGTITIQTSDPSLSFLSESGLGTTAKGDVIKLMKISENQFSLQLYRLNRTTGTYNYQDTATSTTPISLTSGVWTNMTNNGAGGLTLKYRATGKNEVWNVSTNRFDFTQLSLGSHVHIRSHITVTTTSANQNVRGRLVIAEGVLNVSVPIFERTFKTAGTYDIATTELVTVLTNISRDNPASLQVESDSNATAVVQGWNCGVNIY